MTPTPVAGPRVVALGGGHGLSASLAALRHVTDRLTAVVTVADDGGSSGRLRDELGVLPPGDLRMALSALCDDDEWGRTWSGVLQHRFGGQGDLRGHAVGNLLIVALWELLDDPVEGLDLVGRLLGCHGRVLPMSAVPLDIEAQVRGVDPAAPMATTVVRGQVAVATTTGRVETVRLLPEHPPARPEVLTAIGRADAVVLGPGSWFTSVIPHLLVHDILMALRHTPARRVVALNLVPEAETAGFSAENHLEVLGTHAPDVRIDVVLADQGSVGDVPSLRKAAASLGAELVVTRLAMADGSPRHDPVLLARAYADALGVAGSPPWR